MGQDPSPAWAERCFNRVPMIMSYVILVVTWVAFVVIVSIHSTLIKREEYLHFFIQQIVYNFLFGMTILSLFCAMTINPGQPNPNLAPSGVGPRPEMQEVGNVNLDTTQSIGRRRRDRPPRLDTADPDDIPLRFLRNSQWVNSRIGKDRPSPLPLRFSQPARMSDRLDGDSSPAPDVQPTSAFPLSANPLVPHSAVQAGEDVEEREEDVEEARTMEGDWNTRQSDLSDEEGHNGEAAHDPLLRPSEGRRSIMAKSNDGGPRWCRKCDAWKPDRTHHCRFCRRCTLKMDHHCVWLGTCVGFHNYKPFLLFISYGTLLAFYAMLEAGYESFRFFQDPDEFLSVAPMPQSSLNGTCVGSTCAVDSSSTNGSHDEILDPSPIVSICMAIIGAVFALAVGSLAGYHWWLACRNMTTLENMSHSYPSVLLETAPELSQSGEERAPGWKPDHLLTRIERNRLQREARSINVYDIGIRGNMRCIFGERSRFLAGWPIIRAYRKRDIKAGHFFDVDDHKLERLKDLTRELRYGKQISKPNSALLESREASIEMDSEHEERASWDEDPGTGSSGGRGVDELTDVDLSMERSTQKRPVPWIAH